MTAKTASEQLQNAQSYFNSQSAGYKTWGKVDVLEIALRAEDSEIMLNGVVSFQGFPQIFSSRKNIKAVLVTRQQYASQLKEEVPAILDDQAQLLGVSVRIAKTNNEILKALKGRRAAVMEDGRCVCLGTSLEDAYVAAQLLEKTAKVFIEAKYLGGAKPINKMEAWFMQQYYLLKYSKEAVKNR